MALRVSSPTEMSYEPLVTATPPQALSAEQIASLREGLRALRKRFPGAQFEAYDDKIPVIDEGAWIAPTAVLIGDVRVAARASIWYGCILRADIREITVGAGSNIQDGTVIHLADAYPTIIGEGVVVGHRAVLHGCQIGDHSMVGIQATLLDGSQLAESTLLAAGSVLSPGSRVEEGQLALGIPAKARRSCTDKELMMIRGLAAKYVKLAAFSQQSLAMGRPDAD